MSIEQIDIEKFSELANELPVFDVRSPAEFAHAHMPNAISLPLFTDDQRKIIGTAYKQESRQIAVKIGLEYFSERMKIIHDEVEEKILSWKEIRKETNKMFMSPYYYIAGAAACGAVLLHGF